MLNFHTKINRKEHLIGFYKTGSQVDETTFLIFWHYIRQLKSQKNNGVLPKPIILLIDPTMTNNKLSIKVLNFYSAPEVRRSNWIDAEDKEKESVEQVNVFAELPYQIKLEEFEKTGLDVIFYGQEHVDTMAIMQEKTQPDQSKIKELMTSQKLFSNKDLMDKNFTDVIKNLEECEKYVQDVLDGKKEPNSDLGRIMDECLGQFSTDDMEILESLISSNFEDAVMINNLSKLQQHQLRISEQLNQIFAESIKTSNNFILQSKKAK